MDIVDKVDIVDIVAEARTGTDFHGRTRTDTDFVDGMDVMDDVGIW